MAQNFTGISDLYSGHLDLSDVTLEEQYSKLSQHDKELVYLKTRGYTNRPPDIDQLIEDPYYLGGEEFYNKGTAIYPFWKEALHKIFPGMLTKYPYLCLSGAIGIGKSTISKLCMAMTYARLSCMPNPYKSLFKSVPKVLSFVIFHRNVDTAEKEFKKYFRDDVLKKSPFFINPPYQHKLEIVCSGPSGGGGLGTDALIFIMGEINFWDNQEKATERINQSLIRLHSRFNDDVLENVGNFIVDSSAKGSASASNNFLDRVPKELCWNCRPAHYDVKPWDYKASAGKTFPVYIGDGRYSPQILNEDSDLRDDMDHDRLIHVPIEKKPDYIADIYKSLQDISGISTGSSNSFFNGNISHLASCCKNKNLIPETIIVDFYDKSEKLIDRVEPMIRLIPKSQPLWIGLDLAVATDTTGICASSFDHWEEVGGTKVPFYKVWFLFGLTRKVGQETSLFHVYQFLKDMSTRYRIIVSADQAYSKNILQDLEREGIQTRYISTDRTSEPAMYLKNVINLEQIELPKNLRLLRETYDLQVVPPRAKVDHPKVASMIYDNLTGKLPGSKDIWDALSSSIYSCNLSVKDGEEMGYRCTYQKQLDVISRMTSSSHDVAQENIQDMLEGIY